MVRSKMYRQLGFCRECPGIQNYWRAKGDTGMRR